ncbi:unnamed protein product [Durusdinium trenchii]|uniref:Uncharacterized protein n=1 Tax=Durusdinium trenchii TaxID=1381693 RepID=A0ABP0NBX2_9DINO
MARNEAALRELLARYQPELAGRLAKRIAQYGATDAVLAEGAKPEPSPLLRDIIDAALAEELGDGGLFDETAVPQAAQAARVTDVAKGSGLEGGARGARGAPAHQADAPDSLLQRLARYQPELAPQLLRRIEHEGSDIVAQCLRSDSALRRHMERALEELFADEDQAQADSAELGRGSGSHMLPGQRKTLAISSRPKVDPAIRSIRSSAPSLAAPAATTSPSPPVGANAPGAPRRPEAEGLTPEAMDTGDGRSEKSEIRRINSN